MLAFSTALDKCVEVNNWKKGYQKLIDWSIHGSIFFKRHFLFSRGKWLLARCTQIHKMVGLLLELSETRESENRLLSKVCLLLKTHISTIFCEPVGGVCMLFCRLSMSFLLKPSQKKVWTSGSFAQICHPLAQERDRFGRPITDGNSLHRPLCRTPQIVTVHSLDGGNTHTNTHTHTWIHKVQVKGKNKKKTTSKIKHQSHRTVAREIG